ncbi:hypothetical protein G8C92_30270 [Paenibacillus donghaensis]|uniref:AlkZ-related protein n=1 Tax=Paenibacillus donghaensis TaxID=414771 RepID=UPI0018847BDA|nr:hypothetical protein [Paenibacillus donghaensis]MBE9918287.1 hypothetical protein [Paenibacillus donghaensis]
MNEANQGEAIVRNYDEAAEYIMRIGILPLASCIPEFPSLESITRKESWHSGEEDDPWTWRTRFPYEGKAGYGKFMKKKAFLISAEWFPLVYACLGMGRDAENCYQDGLLSKTAWELYQLIDIDQGIDTRALRERAHMKAVEDKKAFDRAVLELQETMLIVISGVKTKVNEAGEANGWSSTAYETTEHWMKQNGIGKAPCSKQEAGQQLLARLQDNCSSRAFAYFKKQFQQ